VFYDIVGVRALRAKVRALRAKMRARADKNRMGRVE